MSRHSRGHQDFPPKASDKCFLDVTFFRLPQRLGLQLPSAPPADYAVCQALTAMGSASTTSTRTSTQRECARSCDPNRLMPFRRRCAQPVPKAELSA